MTTGPARRRVLVTGIGVVNAAFLGGRRELDGWLAAPAGAGSAAAPVGVLIDETEARRLSRVCQLAVGAGRLAVADAGLAAPDADTGLIVGTEFGDFRSTIAFADGYLQQGPAGLSALLFPSTVMNTMAAATTIAVGARALSLTLNVPTVAGELAVARAVAAVAAGRVDAVLAGGVDEREPLRETMLAELGATEARGEGAAFVVLEDEAHARQRGAEPIAEIRGVGWRSLAARPHGVGRGAASPAIQTALAMAGIEASDIGWVYGSAGGDARRDDWQASILSTTLPGRQPPTAALASLLGVHAGIGPLAVAAAGWTTRSGRLPGRRARVAPAPGLVYGVARGGTEVALVVAGT